MVVHQTLAAMSERKGGHGRRPRPGPGPSATRSVRGKSVPGETRPPRTHRLPWCSREPQHRAGVLPERTGQVRVLRTPTSRGPVTAATPARPPVWPFPVGRTGTVARCHPSPPTLGSSLWPVAPSHPSVSLRLPLGRRLPFQMTLI